MSTNNIVRMGIFLIGISMLLLIFSPAACALLPDDDANQNPGVQSDPKAEYVPGEVLVEFKDVRGSSICPPEREYPARWHSKNPSYSTCSGKIQKKL